MRAAFAPTFRAWKWLRPESSLRRSLLHEREDLVDAQVQRFDHHGTRSTGTPTQRFTGFSLEHFRLAWPKGRILHAGLAGPKRLVVFEAADHNDWADRVDAGGWRAALAFALDGAIP